MFLKNVKKIDKKIDIDFEKMIDFVDKIFDKIETDDCIDHNVVHI